MTKLLRRLLWFLFCATITGAFIVGQITHKEISWLENPSWFFAWILICREIVITFALLGARSTVDDAISGKRALTEGFAKILKELPKHSLDRRFFAVLHRLIDFVMVVALASAGWFVSAFVYLACSQVFNPGLMELLETKCREHFEKQDVDDAPKIAAEEIDRDV